MSESGTPQNGEFYYKLAANLETINRFGVKRIGLFGSALRGDITDDSDIDILVEFAQDGEKYTNLMDLHEFLQGLFGKRRVDLVTYNGLSPYLAPHILKEVRYVEGST